MTIRFACTCGQQLAARDEYVGRQVRCTSCNAIVTVPAAPAASPMPPALAPAPPRPAPAPAAGGFSPASPEQPAPPQGRRSPGKLPKGPIIGGLVVLVLVGVFFLARSF